MIKKGFAIFLFALLLTDFSACKKTTDPVCPEWAFYIPNAFEPNGNGINDTFSPKGTGIISFEMWIYDQNGSQIFHTTNINTPWDGRVQGGSLTICPEGIYTYLIKATDSCNYNHTYTGAVTLLR